MVLKLISPAKVNLFLEVLSPRDDGFHNISTIFEKIDLSDTITFRPIKSGIKLESNNKSLPSGSKNIAFQAAALFLKSFKITSGLSITIDKKIPIAAGLGGGSSNAATVLLGANQVFGLRLKKQELLPLGRKLGSDVPLFLEKASFAIGEGRGDIVTALTVKAKLWHILIHPPVTVYTRDIYQEIKIEKNNLATNFTNNYEKKIDRSVMAHTIARTIEKIERKLRLTKNSASSITTILNYINTILYNRLQQVTEKKFVEVRNAKKALERYGIKPLMSGSGPTVFGLVKSRKEAIAIKDELQRQNNWDIFIAKTF
ncbi:MAG: 4-(cytidine 5'-diphospho)-2-C-methyl-D-erythritol kinase [Candidatus Omnitrophota bacterium]